MANWSRRSGAERRAATLILLGNHQVFTTLYSGIILNHRDGVATDSGRERGGPKA